MEDSSCVLFLNFTQWQLLNVISISTLISRHYMLALCVSPLCRETLRLGNGDFCAYRIISFTVMHCIYMHSYSFLLLLPSMDDFRLWLYGICYLKSFIVSWWTSYFLIWRYHIIFVNRWCQVHLFYWFLWFDVFSKKIAFVLS